MGKDDDDNVLTCHLHKIVCSTSEYITHHHVGIVSLYWSVKLSMSMCGAIKVKNDILGVIHEYKS